MVCFFNFKERSPKNVKWKLCIPHRLKAFSSKRLPKPFWKNQVTCRQGASKITSMSQAMCFRCRFTWRWKKVITSRTARSMCNDLESSTIVVGTWLWPGNILISLTRSFHTLCFSDEHQRKEIFFYKFVSEAQAWEQRIEFFSKDTATWFTNDSLRVGDSREADVDDLHPHFEVPSSACIKMSVFIERKVIIMIPADTMVFQCSVSLHIKLITLPNFPSWEREASHLEILTYFNVQCACTFKNAKRLTKHPISQDAATSEATSVRGSSKWTFRLSLAALQIERVHSKTPSYWLWNTHSLHFQRFPLLANLEDMVMHLKNKHAESRDLLFCLSPGLNLRSTRLKVDTQNGLPGTFCILLAPQGDGALESVQHQALSILCRTSENS